MRKAQNNAEQLDEEEPFYEVAEDCDFEIAVSDELSRATVIHGSFRSYHEGIAVLREEYLELEHEVFKKKPDTERLREEVIQVAAMAKKFYEFINKQEQLSGD